MAFAREVVKWEEAKTIADNVGVNLQVTEVYCVGHYYIVTNKSDKQIGKFAVADDLLIFLRGYESRKEEENDNQK